MKDEAYHYICWFPYWLLIFSDSSISEVNNLIDAYRSFEW